MILHKGSIEIESDRLILRKFRKDDASEMFKNWANDDDVTKNLTWPTHKDISVTEYVISRWLESYTDEVYHWAIVLKENNEVIGSITSADMSDNNERCEVGYCIGKDYWGKGIVTEALKTSVKFLFEEVGLNRIAALHYIENIASGKVMIKAGMTYEGVKRKYIKKKDGTFVDCASYSILKDDKRDY